jgi:hypothetical protein
MKNPIDSRESNPRPQPNSPLLTPDLKLYTTENIFPTSKRKEPISVINTSFNAMWGKNIGIYCENNWWQVVNSRWCVYLPLGTKRWNNLNRIFWNLWRYFYVIIIMIIITMARQPYIGLGLLFPRLLGLVHLWQWVTSPLAFLCCIINITVSMHCR